MSPPSVWIETGPDGRPRMMRKQSKSASTRQLFSHTSLARSARSLFSSLRQSRDNCETDTQAPLALPAPESSSSTLNPPPRPTTPMAPASHAQSQPMTTYLMHPLQNQNQAEAAENQTSQANPFGIPHQINPGLYMPGMFPMLPHPLSGRFPNTFHPLMPLPPHHAPFHVLPTVPLPNTAPLQTHPQGSFVQNPTTANPLPPQAEMRYKCEICGRYRSARYHYKHPVPPGQFPAKTICRKCQEEATDSEETTTSESYQQSRSTHPKTRRRPPRRRSRLREHVRLNDDRHSRYESPVYSDSRSPSPDRRQHGRGGGRRHRRAATPGPDLLRGIHGLHLSPRGERIYYDERRDHPHQRDPNERRNGPGPITRARSHSRAPAPDPTILRRQFADPFAITPHVDHATSTHHSNFDGPARAHRREAYSPQRGPSPPRGRQASMPGGPEYPRQPTTCRDVEYGGSVLRPGYLRLSSRSARGWRQTRQVDEGDLPLPQSVWVANEWNEENYRENYGRQALRAPSPPILQAPSLEHMNQADYDDPEPGRARSRRSRRRPSPSPSWDSEEPEDGGLRVGDELTVIERHEPAHREDDYDWYDDQGMRVKVREVSR